MNSLMLMPLVMPLMLPGGFDGVEPYSASPRLCVRNTTGARNTSTTGMPGVRALARELGRSPSHVCRVLRGERQSKRLMARIRAAGIKVEEVE